MRVALTGANGSIGSYVLRELLEHGHELVAAGRTAPATEGVRHVPASLDDAGARSRGRLRARTRSSTSPAITSPYRGSVEERDGGECRGHGARARGGGRLGRGQARVRLVGRSDRVLVPARRPRAAVPAARRGAPVRAGRHVRALEARRRGALRRAGRAHTRSRLCRLRINHNWNVDRRGAEAALLRRVGEGVHARAALASGTASSSSSPSGRARRTSRRSRATSSGR